MGVVKFAEWIAPAIVTSNDLDVAGMCPQWLADDVLPSKN